MVFKGRILVLVFMVPDKGAIVRLGHESGCFETSVEQPVGYGRGGKPLVDACKK